MNRNQTSSQVSSNATGLSSGRWRCQSSNESSGFVSDKTSTVYDVIISGAGPVGLFLACELALANCTVLVIEKNQTPHSPLKNLPFGIRGLSAPTIEALDRRGLLNELEIHKRLKDPHQSATHTQPVKRQVGHFAGIPLFEELIDQSKWQNRLPTSTSLSLISEIGELETLFTKRALELGVVIQRGAPLTALDQTETDVCVTADDLCLRARWFVGCDGSRSATRKLSGFVFEGTEPEFTGYTTQIAIVDPEKLNHGRNLTPEGMYLQSQPGYVMIQDFDRGAFHDSKVPLTLEHIEATLRRISQTDVSLRALHVATTWTDRARQVTSYRNGRVLLAGDAAHIHSPLGGQGLNLGIGDAMNLGWKLAAIIKDRAPEGLLDSYHFERHPIGEKVLDWSRAQVSVMRPEPAARAVNAVLKDLLNTRDGATYIAARIWGVDTRYDLNFKSECNSARANDLIGQSAPNFAFSDGKTLGEHLRNGRGLLVDFSPQHVLSDFAENLRTHLNYVSSPHEDKLGLDALLVRPDGIVAWATDAKNSHVVGGDQTSTVEGLLRAIQKWISFDVDIAISTATD